MEVNGINLDPTATAGITDTIGTQSRQTNQSVANDYTSEGKRAGRGLLTQEDSFNKGLAYDNPMSTAIKKRYMGDYNLKENELSNRMLRSASEDRIRSLHSASQMAAEEVQQNKQKEMLRNEIDQANKRARGAVLGNVLGIVGGIVGGIYGGAGGAQAGYAAGSGIGQAAGEGG